MEHVLPSKSLKTKMLQKNKPLRSKRYLDFIRSLPCLLAGPECSGAIEAAHSGPHGLGTKASDLTAVSLCVGHHRTRRDSYHQLGRRFAEHHGLDLTGEVAALNARFEAAHGKKAA